MHRVAKKLEKGVDKSVWEWYNTKAVRESGGDHEGSSVRPRTSKKLKKVLKKYLTRANRCDIIDKLPHGSEHLERKSRKLQKT